MYPLIYLPHVPDQVPLLRDVDSGQVGLRHVDQRQALLDGGAPGLPLVPLHIIVVLQVELVVVLLAAVRLV